MNASHFKNTADAINANPEILIQRRVESETDLIKVGMSRAAENGKYEYSEFVADDFVKHLQDFQDRLIAMGFTVSTSPTLSDLVKITISWK